MNRKEQARQRNYRMIALGLSIAFHLVIIAFLVFGTGGEGDQTVAQEVTSWVSGWGGEVPTQP